MSHPFDRTCHKHGITHDLFPSGNPGNIGKLSHPRPETQITGDRQFYYEDHAHLREHFLSFFDTYNFTRRLKSIQGLTLHEFVCLSWKTEPGLVLLAVVFAVLMLSGGPDISTVVTQETLQKIVVDPTSMGWDAS